MRIKKDYFWIAFACILLGVFIALQIKYLERKFLQDTQLSDKSKDILLELTQVKAEKEKLLGEISNLESQLDEIKNSASLESSVVKNLTLELEKYRSLAGYTKVSGPGIIITLDNPPKVFESSSDKNIALDYRLVLDLINELHASKAEAISINEQRVVSNSEIRLAGTQMNVNNVPLSTPYVIKVIGSPDTLDGGISQRFGVVQSIRERGYYVEVRKVDVLEILPFTGSFQFIFSTIVK